MSEHRCGPSELKQKPLAALHQRNGAQAVERRRGDRIVRTPEVRAVGRYGSEHTPARRNLAEQRRSCHPLRRTEAECLEDRRGNVDRLDRCLDAPLPGGVRESHDERNRAFRARALRVIRVDDHECAVEYSAATKQRDNLRNRLVGVENGIVVEVCHPVVHL
jgi:hypothetical protein